MKIIGTHREGCYALEDTKSGLWSNPWAFLPYDNEQQPKKYGERYEGDILGRSKGKRRMVGSTWFRIVCNDPGCKAILQVSEKEILDFFIVECKEVGDD